MLPLFLAVALVSLGMIYLMSRGAPYVPSDSERVRKIVEMAGVKNSDRAVDIGSGDGRIVIAMAKAGAEAHGYEINPFLVLLSKRAVRRAGLRGKALIHGGDFWSKDFSEFDVVVVFGISYIMKRLEKKLLAELKPGARVVVSTFVFPTWKPLKSEGNLSLYVC